MSTAITRTPLIPSSWEEIIRIAKNIHLSGLCPETIKTPEQAATIILAGAELGIGVMMSLRELYPVHNQVGMSTKLMCALLRQAGHDYQIDERTAESCTTTILLKNGKRHAMTLTMKEAVTANWHRTWDKETKGWKDKPMWVSCPDLMLMYRCLSKNIRANGPDAILLMKTKDELEDGHVIEGTATVIEEAAPTAQPAPPPPAPATQASEPPKADQPTPSGNGQGAAWTTNENRVKALHAWIGDALKIKAVNLTWETIKAKALHVEHLAQFAGTEGDAQRAVLALIADILKQAGNPAQGTLEPVQQGAAR